MPEDPARGPDALRRSVVKLFTVVKKPNYYQPWDLGYQKTSGGSGCVLPNRRILTNAHVVSNQVYVQVLKTGDTRKYTATVAEVCHGLETAILTVEDPAFFDDTRPVELGDLPLRQDEVAAYGFPVGGNELSVTRGVVSRIEVQTYTHSQRQLLSVQIDAAINPGNSGGPVFKEGKLIGIAFQSHAGTQVEKSGYVVPVPVLRRFLDEVDRGICRDVPDLGVYWQRIESDALRASLGMDRHQTGVLVTRVVHGSSAHGALEEDDVILAVDGAPVADDGSVALRDEDRVNFSHVVTQHHVGEALSVEVLRAGERRRLPVELRGLVSLVPPPAYDVRPTYFIFAGVVFTPLTYDYLRVWDWKDMDPPLRTYYAHGLPSADRRQIVLVNQVLAHDANVGYHRLANAVVDRVNGIRVGHIDDVVRALSRPVAAHHVIDLDHHGGRGPSSDFHSFFGTRLVLDASLAQIATDEVLARYGIPADRSKDLAGLG